MHDRLVSGKWFATFTQTLQIIPHIIQHSHAWPHVLCILFFLCDHDRPTLSAQVATLNDTQMYNWYKNDPANAPHAHLVSKRDFIALKPFWIALPMLLWVCSTICKFGFLQICIFFSLLLSSSPISVTCTAGFVFATFIWNSRKCCKYFNNITLQCMTSHATVHVSTAKMGIVTQTTTQKFLNCITSWGIFCASLKLFLKVRVENTTTTVGSVLPFSVTFVIYNSKAKNLLLFPKAKLWADHLDADSGLTWEEYKCTDINIVNTSNYQGPILKLACAPKTKQFFNLFQVM